MSAEYKAQCLAQYEKIVSRYSGDLTEADLAAAAAEIEEIVPKGRYVGISGTFYNTGVRRTDPHNRVEGLRLGFISVFGGDETKMPVIDCIEYYRFFAPELL